MAVKTILGQVIIWYDREEPFDVKRISNVKNNDLNYWTEIEEIAPPVSHFSDGEKTDSCKWFNAKVITNIPEKKLSLPQLCGGRVALSKAMDETPEHISFRWKYD